jgi:hypothetical protein
VFLAYAEHKALLRYAQALQLMTQGLALLLTATPPPASLAITAARYGAIFPLLRQRLQVLAMGLSTKARQHQLHTAQAAESMRSLVAPLQTLPAFLDAQAYFQDIAGAMRSLLDTPPAVALRSVAETDVPPRRPQQRRGKTPRADKRLQQLSPLPEHRPPAAARYRDSQC